MERLLDELDLSLYGTDTTLLCERLRSKYRVIEHDGDKLPDIYQRYLKEKQIYSLFVRSHMGSGKTYQLKKIITNMRRSAKVVRKDLKVLIITPKRTFATYVTSQLKDFVDYRHVRRPYSCVKYPRFVVQLQSLKNFEDIENDSFNVRGYSVVILDEVHSLVEEMFSDLSDQKEKKRNISLFVKVLRAIPRWICLDAHLSVDLINILKEVDNECGLEKSHICLINRYVRSDFKLIFYRKCLYNSLVVRQLKQKLYKSDKFRQYKPLLCTQKIADIVLQENHACLIEKLFMKIYVRDFLKSADDNDILVHLYDALSRNRKICVTSSTKLQATMLKKLYKACGFKVKLITGDSSEEVKSKFACDPDAFIKGCQLFIYTTAFQVGIDVSSRETYFDTHYVFIECSTQVASPGAFVQTVGRIRTLKSKEYKIVVLDTKKENGDMSHMKMNDLLPMSRDQLLSIGKTNGTTRNVCNMLVDMHHKEKAIGKNIYLYTNMFIRLLRCKAEPFVMINGHIYPSKSVVNFHSFQFSYKEYSKFTDDFIVSYQDEIQKTLDKYVSKIWQKLESSSIYVSTLVNNFNAFVQQPKTMSRAECLTNVCEFMNRPFGFLHTFVFETTLNEVDNVFHRQLKKRYFEQCLQRFFLHSSYSDLERLKPLVWKFLQTCTNDGTCNWRINSAKFHELLQSEKNEIIFCYSRFVSKVFGKSVTTLHLFEKLLSKSMRLFIHKNVIDVSEIFKYKQIIDINKMLLYNMNLLVGFTSGIQPT